MKHTTEKLKSLIALMVTLLIATSVSGQKPAIEWADIPAGTFTMGSPTDDINHVWYF